jgi:hypothetical protein
MFTLPFIHRIASHILLVIKEHLVCGANSH